MTDIKYVHSNQDKQSEDVASPCRALCKLSPEKICSGCFRSSTEISFWVTMDNEQKRDVVENAKKREAHFLKTNQYLQ